ncbi:MAG: transporter substrate-binding domain-containing protein, partial [Angelakisella sp.]
MKIPHKLLPRLAALVECAALLCAFIAPAYAAEDKATTTDTPKVIRVAWFDYAGFYMVDGNGYRSGYTYDYLQEMARYGGWRYEYVSGTIPECLEMLENGEIDLMGAMMHSDERAETMDFSKLSMGENFSILTVRADEHRYRIDSSKEDLDGIHIGVLDG